MKKANTFLTYLFRSPLLWGGLISALYYGALELGVVDNAYLLRFTAGHVVEYIVTVAFFTGLSALVVKAVEVGLQRNVPEEALLGPVPFGGQTPEDAAQLLADLDQAPSHLEGGYLVRRLRDALTHVHRKSSADALDTEIKFLSDMDAIRSQHSYAFVRVIIWAIPILGLLGTVIGITSVFANLKLDPKHIDASLPQVMDGLKVAFDTTGLALGLSMTLMFVQYFVDRTETRLLSDVDERMNAELVGRFQSSIGASDPQLGGVRRMIESVLQSNDRLVARQAEIWGSTIQAADKRWAQLTAAGGHQLETALAGALDRSLTTHAAHLAATEQSASEQNRRQWAQVQQALVQTTEAAIRNQAELSKQSDVLLKMVEATNHVSQLEQTLNRNLTALAGARNFDETLVALSAAVQLLSVRLGQAAGDVPAIHLSKQKLADRAA